MGGYFSRRVERGVEKMFVGGGGDEDREIEGGGTEDTEGRVGVTERGGARG